MRPASATGISSAATSLVTSAGEGKFLDFGLVMNRLDAEEDSFSGDAVGTLAHMSPEQAGGP